MGLGGRGEITAVESANPQNSESNATFPAGNGYEQLKRTAMKPGIRVMARLGRCLHVWARPGHAGNIRAGPREDSHLLRHRAGMLRWFNSHQDSADL